MGPEVRRKYRILFIGYWNADDGLTSSTILPNLRILRSFPHVEALYFANTQRGAVSKARKDELHHLSNGYFPLTSRSMGINVITKLVDFIRFPRILRHLCRRLKINYVIARGAPAGALAWLVSRRTGIPYSVESFEPHAEYMRSTKTWLPYDLRYIFQKYWEGQQKLTAEKLVVVSHRYKAQLLKEGISFNRVLVAPCGVDPTVFYPDLKLRMARRDSLAIPPFATVGIYAGKFGGLYEYDKAFEIFRKCYQSISNFYLLLLTGHDKVQIVKSLDGNCIPRTRVKILSVAHHEVNAYLNAADFAFALYKTTPVSAFLSPVKIAEYWAVGLPVLITKNVGDESLFVEERKMGLIYDQDVDLTSIIKMSSAAKIRGNALCIRTFEKVRESYKEILQ